MHAASCGNPLYTSCTAHWHCNETLSPTSGTHVLGSSLSTSSVGHGAMHYGDQNPEQRPYDVTHSMPIASPSRLNTPIPTPSIPQAPSIQHVHPPLHHPSRLAPLQSSQVVPQPGSLNLPLPPTYIPAEAPPSQRHTVQYRFVHPQQQQQINPPLEHNPGDYHHPSPRPVIQPAVVHGSPPYAVQYQALPESAYPGRGVPIAGPHPSPPSVNHAYSSRDPSYVSYRSIPVHLQQPGEHSSPIPQQWQPINQGGAVSFEPLLNVAHPQRTVFLPAHQGAYFPQPLTAQPEVRHTGTGTYIDSGAPAANLSSHAEITNASSSSQYQSLNNMPNSPISNVNAQGRLHEQLGYPVREKYVLPMTSYSSAGTRENAYRLSATQQHGYHVPCAQNSAPRGMPVTIDQPVHQDNGIIRAQGQEYIRTPHGTADNSHPLRPQPTPQSPLHPHHIQFASHPIDRPHAIVQYESAPYNGPVDAYGNRIHTGVYMGHRSVYHAPQQPVPKKRRLHWTPELHAKFEAAIQKIGIDEAVPKTLLQEMNVPSLTRENVASHLQKHREMIRKRKADEERREKGPINQRSSTALGESSSSVHTENNEVRSTRGSDSEKQ